MGGLIFTESYAIPVGNMVEISYIPAKEIIILEIVEYTI
jgi:hypothetical protein